MTKQEFVKGWCERSKIDPIKLDELQLEPLPCACGEDGCHGWAMVHKLNREMHLELYAPKENNPCC